MSREALDVAGRQRRRRSAERTHQRRVLQQDLVRALAMAEPDLVGLLGVPGDRAVRAVDLPLERVLPAGADLGNADRAARAVLEAQQDRRGVLGPDLALDGFADSALENVSTGPVGSRRVWMNVARSAMTLTIRCPVTKVIRSSQCEPMSPTARSAPPRSGWSRQFQSVSRSSQSWK